MSDPLTFEIPSPSKILDMVRANITPPNLNVEVEALEAATKNMKTQIASLTSASTGIADEIANLKSTLQTQLSNIQTKIKSIQASVTKPLTTLQGDMQAALNKLQTAPQEFLQHMQGLQLKYPSADIQGILDQMATGDFDIGKHVPNIKILNGEEIERAITSKIPSFPTEELKKLADIEIPKLPDLPKELTFKISTIGVSANNNTLNLGLDDLRSLFRTLHKQ